jgi:hypothetical protein
MHNSAVTVEVVGLAFEKAGAEAWAAANGNKRTPLYYLMENSAVTVEVVRHVFKKAGAEAWAAADGSKWTPLHYLLESSAVTVEVVGLAFEMFAPEVWVLVNGEGKTPLGCLDEDLEISGEEFVELFRAADPGESLALPLCGAAHAPHRRLVNQAPRAPAAEERDAQRCGSSYSRRAKLWWTGWPRTRGGRSVSRRSGSGRRTTAASSASW